MFLNQRLKSIISHRLSAVPGLHVSLVFDDDEALSKLTLLASHRLISPLSSYLYERGHACNLPLCLHHNPDTTH